MRKFVFMLPVRLYERGGNALENIERFSRRIAHALHPGRAGISAMYLSSVS